MSDELWTTIVDMIWANLGKIDASLKAKKYGQAAHFDSKNVALIEVLELDCNCVVQKDATVKERLAAAKKARKK